MTSYELPNAKLTTSAGQRRQIKTIANMHGMHASIFFSASCLHLEALQFMRNHALFQDVIVPLSIQSKILAGAAETTE